MAGTVPKRCGDAPAALAVVDAQAQSRFPDDAAPALKTRPAIEDVRVSLFLPAASCGIAALS